MLNWVVVQGANYGFLSGLQFYIFAFGRQECLHINPCLKCVGCSVIGLQILSFFQLFVP